MKKDYRKMTHRELSDYVMSNPWATPLEYHLAHRLYALTLDEPQHLRKQALGTSHTPAPAEAAP